MEKGMKMKRKRKFLQIIIAFCLIAVILLLTFSALSETLDAQNTTYSEANEKITLDPSVFAELTTDEIWDKMQIQIFKNKDSMQHLIWDGNKFISLGMCAPSPPYTPLVVCDIDGDGEYELIY